MRKGIGYPFIILLLLIKVPPNKVLIETCFALGTLPDRIFDVKILPKKCN